MHHTPPQPMVLTHPTRLTAEQFAALDHQGRRFELVRGEVVEMSFAAIPHGRIEGRLFVALFSYVREHKLGEVFPGDTGTVLQRNPDTVRAPDVWFVAGDRARATRVFLEGGPDLAVEVLSPDDRAREVTDKVQQYLAARTRLVWVIEPKTQTVMVYRASGQHQLLGIDDTLAGEDVVPGFALTIRTLFAD